MELIQNVEYGHFFRLSTLLEPDKGLGNRKRTNNSSTANNIAGIGTGMGLEWYRMGQYGYVSRKCSSNPTLRLELNNTDGDTNGINHTLRYT